MAMPSPERLLQSSARGDRESFAGLYTALAPAVHGMVLRVLRDPHQAEEVTQEVFLQAWLESGRFDPTRGSARGWLMTLAHRRAVDRVRASEAGRRRDHAWTDDGQGVAADTESLVEASLEAQRLRAALAELSSLQRQAVELSYFGGLTHVEVSRLLGVPLGTAKWRIREGLTRLRDALVPSGEAHLATSG
jgi:RNA polymerase sigma-70 factor, ECF subfamily